MRVTALIVLSLFAWASQAAVYRWVDADGTVHFSDQPHAGAQEIMVEPLPTVPSVQAPRSKEVPAIRARYERFEVTKPAQGESIRANDGRVSVSLVLSRGDRIDLALDGKPLPEVGSALSFNLSNLARGGHTVQASVVDAAGNSVISTPAVTFYVLRAIAAPKPPPPPAPKASN